MKKLFLLICLGGLVGSATATKPLYSNGPAVLGDPPLSILRPSGDTLGFGMMSESIEQAYLGDNFTVSGPGWDVQNLSFFAYQRDTANLFTFTTAIWRVIAGTYINNGTVVASGRGGVSFGGLVGYRVGDGDLGSQSRAIFQINVDVPDFTLAPGNYWLNWSLAGSEGAAFQPPTADGKVGNAVRSLEGRPFETLYDTDGLRMEFPFLVHGSVVPEPSTYALMLAGALTVVGAARRRRQH